MSDRDAFRAEQQADEDDQCSYCGDTGWVWVNAVECAQCEAGRALAKRWAVYDAPLDAAIAAVEVPDGE